MTATHDYTGKVNYDARTGCFFTVKGETFRVLDSFPNWLHFANVLTGERFNADYDRLIECNAVYTAPV